MLHERQPCLRGVRQDGGRQMSECRRDRALVARLDVERAERETLAPLRQRPRRRRQPFALVERTPKRRRSRLSDPGLLLELGADMLDDRLPKARDEIAGGLPAELEALATAPQPVQRSGGALSAARLPAISSSAASIITSAPSIKCSAGSRLTGQP